MATAAELNEIVRPDQSRALSSVGIVALGASPLRDGRMPNGSLRRVRHRSFVARPADDGECAPQEPPLG